MQKILNHAEMVECEGIQAIVNQAAVQMVTAVMMTVSDADVEPNLPLKQACESHRDRLVGPALESPHLVGMPRTGTLKYLTLRYKFNPCLNGTVLSLQDLKLEREYDQIANKGSRL